MGVGKTAGNPCKQTVLKLALGSGHQMGQILVPGADHPMRQEPVRDRDIQGGLVWGLRQGGLDQPVHETVAGRLAETLDGKECADLALVKPCCPVWNVHDPGPGVDGTANL